MNKLLIGMSAATLLASAAFANEPENTQLAAVDTSPAAFSKLDMDKDGRVSAIEAANDSNLAAAFTQADADRDGYLSSAEFQSLGSGSTSTGEPSQMPPDSSSTTPPSDTTTPPADTTTPPTDTTTPPQ
jgi:hypothetical protein